jgi:hypothetical protein
MLDIIIYKFLSKISVLLRNLTGILAYSNNILTVFYEIIMSYMACIFW